MLMSGEDHRFAIRLGEKVRVEVQGKPGGLFGRQERVEQSLSQRFRINSQSNADVGASMKRLQPRVRRVEALGRLRCVGAKNVPLLNVTAGPETDYEI